ncbi:MAG: hypothetical protein AB2697_08690 [Candidatus Thiodiazotropha endolucinida]
MKYIDVRGEREYVLDTHTNEILGEIKRYYYAGSDFRYAMHRLLADKAGTCPSPERDSKEIPLPVHILKPIRQNMKEKNEGVKSVYIVIKCV